MSHRQQVKILVQTGVDLIQLREKTASPREFFDDAKEAVTYGQQAGVKIIINDRVDIALVLGADGVHLGQDDLSPVHAREILGPGAIIGYSTHSLEQAVEAAKLPVDYIAFGPVFETATKKDPSAVTGIEELRKARSLIEDIPLVAIGGIETRNIADVSATGVNAAAVISSLYQPPGQIKENLDLLKQSWLRKIV